MNISLQLSGWQKSWQAGKQQVKPEFIESVCRG